MPAVNPAVPASTGPESPVEFAEDVIEDVEGLFFPPRPGGIVDTHRKERARRAAADQEQEHADERIERNAFRNVKVSQVSPEIVNPVTIVVPAGGKAMLLPNSPYRYRTVVLVLGSAVSVLLAKDESSGLGGIGFTLTSGIPIVLQNRAQLWAFNASGANISVSVMQEIYGPETS